MSQGKTKKEALDNAEKAIRAYMNVVTSSKNKTAEFTKRTINTPLAA